MKRAPRRTASHRHRSSPPGSPGDGDTVTVPEASEDGEEQLLSIGTLADITGIASDTIRVWERRYGRPVPVRLPSGHRRYTPEHVRWLRRIAEALARGHRLGAVIQSSDLELDRLLLRRDPVAPDWELRQLIDMARDFRGADLMAALRTAWKAMAPLEFLERRIGPLLTDVGVAWADGVLEVRHEHFLTEIVDDLLRALRLELPPPASTPSVLLATLDGEDHALGLQMAALVCTLNDVQPILLGRAAPSREIEEAVRESGAHALAIGVSLANSGVATDRTLAELRRAVPARLRILVGGRGARGVRRGPRGIDYLSEPVLTDFGRWLQALR
ncbi:MAG TPA: MerR family transcriptional regulator [Planctomycetota bacterium]|nr:MerR family transcriptional regulator [Planctomycetota bacterium]